MDKNLKRTLSTTLSFRHLIIVALPILLPSLLTLSGCARKPIKDGPPRYAINVKHIHNPVVHYEPRSPYGNPSSYRVRHRVYHVLKTAKGYDVTGIASWYGTKFNGRLTSSRERYNLLAMTAASPILPIPTFVRVTNLSNKRSVIVKVNDRGPFVNHRVLDLSYAAAKKLGYAARGTAHVRVTAIYVKPPGRKAIYPSTHSHRCYYAQLGAFHELVNAKRLRTNLQNHTSWPVHIRRIVYNHHPLYRVQVGPLPSKTLVYRIKKSYSSLG